MGVDIQTYRARIGTYKHSRCGDTNEKFRQSWGSDVATLVTNINGSNNLKTFGCVLFIGILLIIGGIEPNPGPVGKGFDNCHSDVTPEVEKGAGNSVEDTAPKLYHAESTRVEITGLMENINKQMLEMFFDQEERNGGGKVKDIDINNKNRCAIIEFEDVTGVIWIMKKTPMTIFGMQVHIKVIGIETEELKMIKISKLPANINKEMLLMFFENKKECDGKVVDVTVNTNDSYAIVEFDKSTAVYGVMDQRPFTIFGFQVNVDVFDARKLVESLGPKQLYFSADVSKSLKMVDSAVQVRLCKCPPLETLSPLKQTNLSSCKQSTSVQTRSPSKSSPKMPAADISDTCSSKRACKTIPATKIRTQSKIKTPWFIDECKKAYLQGKLSS